MTRGKHGYFFIKKKKKKKNILLNTKDDWSNEDR